MFLISATINCTCDVNVELEKLNCGNFSVIKRPTLDSITVITRMGRITFKNDVKTFVMTGVRDVQWILDQCFCITNFPFAATFVMCQDRFSITRPKQINKFWLLNRKSNFVARSDLFGTGAFITLIFKYNDVETTKFKIDFNGIEQVHGEPICGEAVIAMYPSGHVTLKGICKETNIFCKDEFCKWILSEE